MPVPYMTNVTLYSGVPWDNTYTDVRYFDGGNVSIPGQVLYNSGATYTYQRVNSSVEGGRPSYTLRVNRPAGELYNCNYMSFNNNDVQGGKTFYCFVNKVNYVAPDTTELVYEIDEFTTWFYDCTVHPCFVEREHAETDSVGDNTVYEPIGTFDMFETQLSTWFPSTTSVVVLTAGESPAIWNTTTGVFEPVKPASGGIIGGIYQAYHLNGPYTTASEVDAFLDNYRTISNEAGIIGVFTVKTGAAAEDWQFAIPSTLQTETATPYTPKNKKLLTAQFNKCIIYSSDGNKLELAFEKYGGIGMCTNTIDIAPSFPTIATLAPNYIKNEPNYNYELESTLSVLSPYLTDAYTDSQGREKISRLITGGIVAVGSMIAAAGVTAAGGGSTAAIGASIAAVGIKAGSEMAATELSKNTLSPTLASGLTDVSSFDLGRVGFWASQKCVGNEAAIQIDDYFDWYGYATMTPKQPNLTGRSLFNYVKTRGAMITGSIPADSMSAIKQMFNNGIRLWHTNKVGQYDPATGNPIG